MPITSSSIRNGIGKIVANLPAIKTELNAADAKLGDGDTGLMVSRMFQSFAGVGYEPGCSVSEYCLQLAQAGAKSTGSSFGTLIVASLMAVAKATRGRARIDDAELGEIVGYARDAMISRGRAEPGSKTAIDSLNSIAMALRNAGATENPAIVARTAAFQALDEFRSQPCKSGRARMFSDKSKGLDDPGMLAVALTCEAIAQN